MTKIVKLTSPEEIEAVRELRDTRDSFVKRAEIMQARHKREIDLHNEELAARTKDIFVRITKAHLQFPHLAFETGTHFIDHTYIDMNDAYLVEVPTEESSEKSASDDTPLNFGPSHRVH